MEAKKTKYDSVDEYIAAFPKETQTLLQELRTTIKSTAPKVEETITYNMPTFDLNGRHLVYFSGFKHHVGLYPVPAGDEKFQEEIARYRSAKSSLNFPIDKLLPIRLIRQFVKFRVAESKQSDDVKPINKKRQAA